MHYKSIIVSFFALMLGAAAFAGEQHRMRVELAVEGDDGQSFRFDAADAGFELHDLQIGESRTITAESGETAMVTRTEDGFEFDVNGKKIRMGDMATPIDPSMVHGEHDILVNVDEDVHVDKAVSIVKVEKSGVQPGVTIISGENLDETTRQQIRDVLSSSGHTGEVTFIDATRSNGDHAQMERVHVITKEVDVTN